MARIGRRRRIGIIALISFGLIAVGAVFFPISMPHFELAAEALWSPFGIPITNTMIGAWLTILVMGGIAYAATRRMRLVPHGLQNVMEASVEMLMNFVESIAGKENGRKFFPVVATIFIFVIANAWLALFPGFMSIGAWHAESYYSEVTITDVSGNTQGAYRVFAGKEITIDSAEEWRNVETLDFVKTVRYITVPVAITATSTYLNYDYTVHKWPLMVGNIWSYESLTGVSNSMTIEANIWATAEVVEIETKTVLAGTFDCYKIVHTMDVDSDNDGVIDKTGTRTEWYSPDVKNYVMIVDEINYDQTEVWELTSFTIQSTLTNTSTPPPSTPLPTLDVGDTWTWRVDYNDGAEVDDYTKAITSDTESVATSAGEGVFLVPFLRGANTDVNFPLALALISFIFVEYWGFKRHGFIRYMGKFVNVRQYFSGVGQILRGRVRSGMGMLFSGIIDIFVGFIEMVSEMVRIMSFTFRLFGNMTAGEILVFSMMFLIPWVAAIPFYGLELFIGFVQALIFCGLTLVFLVMAVAPHEEH